jgi:hypothetical protein
LLFCNRVSAFVAGSVTLLARATVIRTFLRPEDVDIGIWSGRWSLFRFLNDFLFGKFHFCDNSKLKNATMNIRAVLAGVAYGSTGGLAAQQTGDPVSVKTWLRWTRTTEGSPSTVRKLRFHDSAPYRLLFCDPVFAFIGGPFTLVGRALVVHGMLDPEDVDRWRCFNAADHDIRRRYPDYVRYLVPDFDETPSAAPMSPPRGGVSNT